MTNLQERGNNDCIVIKELQNFEQINRSQIFSRERSIFKMDYIVDVQGFKTSLNEFIFKEVAIVALEEDSLPSVFLFMPPFDWKFLLPKNQSENHWLEMNYHGISWSAGDIPYKDLGSTIRVALNDARRVYVKGLEKSRWIKRILADDIVFNIEDLGCEALKKLPKDEKTVCSHHSIYWTEICAAQNVQKMKNWLIEDQRWRTSKVIQHEVDEEDDNLNMRFFNNI